MKVNYPALYASKAFICTGESYPYNKSFDRLFFVKYQGVL